MKGDTIKVSGLWLRNSVNTVQMLAEVDGEWRLVAEEPIDGAFSHIIEPSGIAKSPSEQAATEPVNVIVNGREQTAPRALLGYKDVIEMAGFDSDRILSVTYRLHKGHAGGILAPSETVLARTGAIFSVADTSNA